LHQHGIHYIQGMKYQKHPLLKGSKHKHIRHRQGEINRLGQIHLIRNSTFEPSQKPPGYDSVSSCLSDLSCAFRWNKPAVISMHRLNLMGELRPDNREINLAMLSHLLRQIIFLWPDVEFMTSPELGSLVLTSHPFSDRAARPAETKT
jgi:hypothetical protein